MDLMLKPNTTKCDFSNKSSRVERTVWKTDLRINSDLKHLCVNLVFSDMFGAAQ